MLTWYHLLLTIFLFLLAGFTIDKELLLYLSFTTFFITFTRKFFGGCIIRRVEQKSKVTRNALANIINWDIGFLVLGLISQLKLHYYHM